MNIVDIIAFIPVLYFVVSGYKTGFLKQLFGVIGILLGVIITLHFSNFVVQRVSQAQSTTSPFVPLMVYLLLFISVFMVVALIGRFIEKLLKASQLNITNRIAGALLGIIKAFVLVSLFLWIIDLANLFDTVVKEQSLAYKYTKKFTPIIIEGLGEIIPTLKELIANIEGYFKQIALKIDSSN
ncbi:MAG: CvpA family protein [Bacteroidia bacterium]